MWKRNHLCLPAPEVSRPHGPHLYMLWLLTHGPLRWRHNECDGVSNHQRLDCLFSRLFRRRSKKWSKLRVIGLCEGNSPVTREFPAQSASNGENVSIWWRHHVFLLRAHTFYNTHDTYNCDAPCQARKISIRDMFSKVLRCRQATSHYQSQCWPKYVSPYGVTRPKRIISLHRRHVMYRCYLVCDCYIYLVAPQNASQPRSRNGGTLHLFLRTLMPWKCELRQAVGVRKIHNHTVMLFRAVSVSPVVIDDSIPDVISLVNEKYAYAWGKNIEMCRYPNLTIKSGEWSECVYFCTSCRLYLTELVCILHCVSFGCLY